VHLGRRRAAPHRLRGTWGDGNPLVFWATGPSFDLSGDLGAGMAMALRGTFGVNLAHTQLDWADDEIPLWSGRAELAFSWRLR
jgi:hypothetical protein